MLMPIDRTPSGFLPGCTKRFIPEITQFRLIDLEGLMPSLRNAPRNTLLMSSSLVKNNELNSLSSEQMQEKRL